MGVRASVYVYEIFQPWKKTRCQMNVQILIEGLREGKSLEIVFVCKPGRESVRIFWTPPIESILISYKWIMFTFTDNVYSVGRVTLPTLFS